jgi:zinc protease
MHEDMRDLDAGLSLHVIANLTVGQFRAPPGRFREAAQILARTLADPALPEDHLKEAQMTAAISSQQAAENGETLAVRLLWRLLLGDGVYARFMTREPSIFARITKADIEAWRRDILVRDGLMIVAAGPMDAAEIGREIDQIFARLPQSGKLPAAAKQAVRSLGKLVLVERPVAQAVIIAGAPTKVVVSPEAVPAEIAVQVLGRPATGRLFRAVREKLGATYNVSASLQMVNFDTRLLLIGAAVAEDKAKGALASIREEYDRFLVDGINETELEPIKSVLATGYRNMTQDVAAQALELLLELFLGFPDDYPATYERRLQAYDRAAINADVRSKFSRPPLTVVVVAPSADGFAADCVIKAAEEVGRCE